MSWKGERGPEGRSESTQEILMRRICEGSFASQIDFVEARFQAILIRNFLNQKPLLFHKDEGAQIGDHRKGNIFLKECEKVVTRFDLLKKLDVSLASRIMIDLVNDYKTHEALCEYLNSEVSQEELRRINAAALDEGNQPLSFSFKQ